LWNELNCPMIGDTLSWKSVCSYFHF
jgi:hypothetical protein